LFKTDGTQSGQQLVKDSFSIENQMFNLLRGKRACFMQKNVFKSKN